MVAPKVYHSYSISSRLLLFIIHLKIGGFRSIRAVDEVPSFLYLGGVRRSLAAAFRYVFKEEL
jgi:hypothetical protein